MRRDAERASREAARRERGLLWRMDSIRSGHLLLVQSSMPPDRGRLPDGYLAGEAQTRPIDGVLEAIIPGRSLMFRLTADPTRIVRAPDAPKEGRGRRVALHDPKEQLGRLARKGEQCGFVVPAGADGGMAVTVSPCPPVVGYKDENGKRNKITISPTRFDGRLVVTDARLFADAVRTGIGRARAYGCGLVSLAPVTAG
ncbi:type I-E CRISPR-associated protein Cas6/Cse3/CasE [Marinactinospora thermotolerans]|uniref:type I-E CRISPR-associated protein Cas6/Cse3/CasE n=1 Tax=Marinactinospora thermotolerans TaxID=531310 RepID=UPI002285C989